jgi:hypothetical protein
MRADGKNGRGFQTRDLLLVPRRAGSARVSGTPTNKPAEKVPKEENQDNDTGTEGNSGEGGSAGVVVAYL